jgi:DNA-binding response OmpR family regulator
MSGATILVVGNETSFLEVICLTLKQAGYLVLPAANGQDALDLMSQQMPDLIVMDLMLPQVDGIDIAHWLRKRRGTPIILLSSHQTESNQIAGLEIMPDDQILYRFIPQELVSRVQAVLRQVRGLVEIPSEGRLSFTDLEIDPVMRLVTVKGKEVSLSLKEFELLWLLAKHPHQVFSRRQLLEQIWGLVDYIDPSTVTVHVRRLRKKIEADPNHPAHVLTAWGEGYKFEP